MPDTFENVKMPHTVRRAFTLVLIAMCCAILTVTVFLGLRPFFRSDPESLDPTWLFATLIIAVGGLLVLHLATSDPTTSADAGWLLAIAIITGAPAVIFTMAFLFFPLLLALEYGRVPALSFLLPLPAVAGPALGLGVAASYLLRSRGTMRRRRVVSTVMLFGSVSGAQLFLLSLARISWG